MNFNQTDIVGDILFALSIISVIAALIFIKIKERALDRLQKSMQKEISSVSNTIEETSDVLSIMKEVTMNAVDLCHKLQAKAIDLNQEFLSDGRARNLSSYSECLKRMLELKTIAEIFKIAFSLGISGTLPYKLGKQDQSSEMLKSREEFYEYLKSISEDTITRIDLAISKLKSMKDSSARNNTDAVNLSRITIAESLFCFAKISLISKEYNHKDSFQKQLSSILNSPEYLTLSVTFKKSMESMNSPISSNILKCSYNHQDEQKTLTPEEREQAVRELEKMINDFKNQDNDNNRDGKSIILDANNSINKMADRIKANEINSKIIRIVNTEELTYLSTYFKNLNSSLESLADISIDDPSFASKKTEIIDKAGSNIPKIESEGNYLLWKRLYEVLNSKELTRMYLSNEKFKDIVDSIVSVIEVYLKDFEVKMKETSKEERLKELIFLSEQEGTILSNTFSIN